MRIRQAWLVDLLEREMRVGKGHNRVNSMVYNAYSLSSADSSERRPGPGIPIEPVYQYLTFES